MNMIDARLRGGEGRGVTGVRYYFREPRGPGGRAGVVCVGWVGQDAG